jgi:hypothetical protein
MITRILLTLTLALAFTTSAYASTDSIYDYPFDFTAPQEELQAIQRNFIAQPQVLGDSTFKGERCPASQTLTQNLRVGARNGSFHPYTKGVVTQANILQDHLNRLGFNSGVSDGIIGTNTNAAIERMQAYLGVKVDGIVGPQTRAALNESCGITNVANTTPTSTQSTTTSDVTPLSSRTEANLAQFTTLSFTDIQKQIQELRAALLQRKESNDTITAEEKEELEEIKEEVEVKEELSKEVEPASEPQFEIIKKPEPKDKVEEEIILSRTTNEYLNVKRVTIPLPLKRKKS